MIKSNIQEIIKIFKICYEIRNRAFGGSIINFLGICYYSYINILLFF